MKNYKQLAEEFINSNELGNQSHMVNRRSGIKDFASYLDSLPDQEPKDFPEVSRKAFTCRHDFKIFDELDEESITVYCHKCGTSVEGAKLMLPAAYAQEPKECERCKTVIKNEFNPEFPTSHAGCPCFCHAKDLPKLPEKLLYKPPEDITAQEIGETLADKINQILDYLKNKN